jgi:hypothetical protein
MSPGRSTTSDPQSVRVTRGGDEVSRGIRETRVKGGGRTRGKRVGISPPQLYVTPAALAFWLYTSPPYMMLHADEFQRFEARVGARTMWSLPPPPDRFLRRAEKKFWPKLRESKFASFGRSGRGSAQPASARRRARGMAKDKAPAKSGKATAEPRHDPGWERVRMRSLARLRVVPRSLPREPSSDRQSSPLFDAGGGERGVGSTGGRVAGRI